MKRSIITTTFLSALSFASPLGVLASETAEAAGHGSLGQTFLILALLLFAAKLGSIVEKWGQPAVLGELLVGILLSGAAYYGHELIADISHNEVVEFLAEFGAVILLFQIGLESNIRNMMKVGPTALAVAIIGVVAPFALGAFVIGPLLFPQEALIAHLFIGASLVATSVGITASVFRSLKYTTNSAAQIVLGAAVFDDVLGLLVLAVISAMASGADVSVSVVAILSAKAFGFLAVAILLGNKLAGPISSLFARIHSGYAMKLSIAIMFAFVYAYLATLVGLAPIVGAFAAGLVLDAVHFVGYDKPLVAYKLEQILNNRNVTDKRLQEAAHALSHAHVEDMVGSISFIFIPFFFTYTGLQIDFGSILQPGLYLYAAVITVIAVIGKAVAGLMVKGTFKKKLIVGMAMVPRGEVGLIFASVGRAAGAISGELFSVIVLVIIATTFMAPPILKYLIGNKNHDTGETAEPKLSPATVPSYPPERVKKLRRS